MKKFILTVSLLATFVLTTCDSPLGMGLPIDWDPPVVMLDPGPNPKYVKLGTIISGTVTDNVGVERIIMRDSTTGVEYFQGRLLPNNRFEFTLNFTFDNNGEKFSVEIAAFDKIGNVGIDTLTVIVDLRPPLVESAWIERSPAKIAYLEDLTEIKTNLEKDDPFGEKSEHAQRYQNGWFTFTAKLNEDETRIEDVILRIYDYEHFDTPLLIPAKQEGSTLYSPKWIIKEEELIAAGKAASWGGQDYEDGYYTRKERYYYFVSIVAFDRSKNEGTLEERIEDQKFFCMWEKADEPKGIKDSITGTVVYKKMPIQVQLFDDDSLDYAWVGLVTRDQWNGEQLISDSYKFDKNFTDAQKLDKLYDILVVQNKDVYNWKNDDRYSGAHSSEKKTVSEFINNKKNVDDVVITIDTGKEENDYGEFILFTIVQDTKLAPHPVSPPANSKDTLKSRRVGRYYDVNIIDDNIPLIVFDTVDTAQNPGHIDTMPGASTGNSPEENTFPKLQSDGKTFEINGYTLREKGGVGGENKVERFRMAWIPQTILTAPGANEKTIIKQVENALRWHLDLDGMDSSNKPLYPFPEGVQYWVMDDSFYAGNPKNALGAVYTPDASIKTGTPETLGTGDKTTYYTKQAFRKKFSVLHDTDDLKYQYNNFTYNTIKENETKVFVFCAIDNMQKVVFRTLRLLPNKTPPTLTVYDITGKNISGLPNGGQPPNPYDTNYGSASGEITPGYETDRKTYNQNAYPNLKSASISGSGDLFLGESDLSKSLQSYPRKTSVKYWVYTQKTGELAIESIKMEDKTTNVTYNLGYESKTEHALSYIEYFPEVTSRTFLFTVTDSLGNVAQIQRTIAITNAATLINITTEKLSGTYGLNDTITIKANFDSKIEVQGSINNILLNVRYPKTDKTLKYPYGNEGEYVFKQIPCSRVKDLTLEFDFKPSEGDVGLIQTMFNDPKMYFTKTDINKPISLINGAKIIDSQRTDSAFTPGNIIGFEWNNEAHSLQEPVNGKQIELDGIRPVITSIVESGKTSKAVGTNKNYYFKAGETLVFTIMASKDIRTQGGSPVIEYRRTNNAAGTQTAVNNTSFKYQSPNTARGMRFALEIDRTSLPYDGELTNFAYYSTSTSGKIVDDVGNEVNKTVFDAFISKYINDNNIRIYNDQTPPPAPGTELSTAPVTPSGNPTLGTSPTTTWYYSAAPYLTVNETSNTNEPYGQTREFSMDGGLTWKYYPDTSTGTASTWTEWNVGQSRLYLKNSVNNQPWSLQARLVDTAGNIGPVTSQLIFVNQAFPKILSVNIEQAKGTYTAATGQNALTFVVNFDGNVRVTTQNTATITVANRNAANANNTDGTNPSYQIQLQANSGQTTNTQSIRFNWTGIGGASNVKEMLDGLYVSAINMAGLSDQFGNNGGTGSASVTGTTPSAISVTPRVGDPTGSYTAPNLPAGYIVDAIPPRAVTFTPASQGIILDASPTLRKQIKIEFNEDMMKGSGIITVKPASDSLIPPVFENDGYYLDINGTTRYSSPGTNRTYVDGFYDVYNNKNLVAADKNALTESTSSTSPSWGTLRLNPRTGQTVGPYQRLTQGLKIGSGYTGDYSGTNVNTGPNPDGAQTGNARYLIPDTATKWVLDYKLRINDTGNTSITAISNALKKAKFRWQEIDVANISITGNTVTIELNEPLLKGLHWELSYPAGVFTDKAGNNAPALASHEFWTSDAQTPVIRVNRRSYDARPVNANNGVPGSLAGSAGGYPNTPPAATNNWNAGIAVSDINGWGFADFNTIHYRIESETPGAVISSGYYGGTATDRVTNKSSVTAAFNNNAGGVQTANPSNTTATNSAWNNTTATNGTWILTNLIRRSNSSYTVTENGNTVTRTYSGAYSGFRSYNKDATIADLNGVTLSNFGSTINQGVVTFGALEAGKGYVVATARRTSDGTDNGTIIGSASTRGYEGVFRTVIALYNNGDNYANAGANRAVLVEGSNIKNGMPSVAGFPVQDAAESGDNRYVKMFYRSGTYNSQLVWVSTEIVCEWYFIKYGGNRNASTHMSDGEVNNYLTVGYGDLSYGYNLRSSNDGNPD